MKRQLRLVFPLLAATLLASTSVADNVRESRQILCAVVEVTACISEGECETTLPWNLNVPQFIIVDFEKRELRTTKASGENRSTLIKNLERTEESVIAQGFEAGRAFSFVIHRDTGMASIAVAMDGITVSGFGSCTAGGS
jgi:hypothetical protein